LGNFITLEEFFTGTHSSLQQAYSPMTIRFFILQAHYRSTLDFSNDALQAAEKGLKKLLTGYETLGKMMASIQNPSPPAPGENQNPSPPAPLPEGEGRIAAIRRECYAAMNDDFNSPMVIASLFECVRIINSVADDKEPFLSGEPELLKSIFDTFLFNILGMKNETLGDQHEVVDGLMQLVLSMRQKSRETKDWETSDQIRDALQKLHITVKDGKEGTRWNVA
jgi:cysteinyl-tRNA synthetase